jgi:hypothetical protein
MPEYRFYRIDRRVHLREPHRAAVEEAAEVDGRLASAPTVRRARPRRRSAPIGGRKAAWQPVPSPSPIRTPFANATMFAWFAANTTDGRLQRQQHRHVKIRFWLHRQLGAGTTITANWIAIGY